MKKEEIQQFANAMRRQLEEMSPFDSKREEVQTNLRHAEILLQLVEILDSNSRK